MMLWWKEDYNFLSAEGNKPDLMVVLNFGDDYNLILKVKQAVGHLERATFIQMDLDMRIIPSKSGY
jgi:hypothetical protein